MREIKFRWWDGQQVIPHESLRFLAPDCMQYTGLKDRNGVEIYEGDIIAFGDDDKPDRLGMYGCLGVVMYSDSECAFRVSLEDGRSVRLDDHNQFSDGHTSRSVLGNVHENPDLITQSDTGDETDA